MTIAQLFKCSEYEILFFKNLICFLIFERMNEELTAYDCYFAYNRIVIILSVIFQNLLNIFHKIKKVLYSSINNSFSGILTTAALVELR